MATYLFSYRTPKGYVPRSMASAWGEWFEEIGSQVVERGNPVFERSPLGNTSSDQTDLGGYSMITADDLESAVALAKGCPILTAGGGVEVGQVAFIEDPAK